MGASKKKQTVGYRYFMGLHLGICHGPVDEIQEITIDKRVAWSGSVTANGQININKPELFGGDKREGGVAGALDVMMGGSTQTQNSYLAGLLANTPAFRGILSLVWRGGQISANNPYVKPWAVKVRRVLQGWGQTGVWHPSKAAIGADMNPSHIIYQCLTNSDWGMGYPIVAIDDANFKAAADKLYSEGFGLSLLWNKSETIENFVQIVADHVGAIIGVDPKTTLFQMKLIRDDYDPATLAIYDQSHIKQVESYQRSGWGETVNEVTVVYADPATGQKTSVTVQDLANIRVQGGVISQVKQYPGITSQSLASRVAMRDLSASATPLSKIRITGKRTMQGLRPGDVFKISWPKLGLSGVVFRCLSINRGTLVDNTVSIDAVEDIFGLPSSTYIGQQNPGWQEPIQPPTPSTNRRVFEAPYWQLIRTLSDADMAVLPADAGFLATLADRPTSAAYDYDIATGPSYASAGTGQFVPTALLASAISQLQTLASFSNGVDLNLVDTGEYAYIDEEIVRIDAINTSSNTLTIARGCLDTVAATHSAGAAIYFAQDFTGTDEVERVGGETVFVRMLPRTGMGSLALALAPIQSVTMAQRQIRPYPPGKLRIFGADGAVPSSSYPSQVNGPLSVSWAHRNRLQQNLEDESVGNIGPEDGTTYNARLYQGSTLLYQATGLTGTSWNPIVTGVRTLKLELEAVRGGYTSRQKHSHIFDLYYPIAIAGSALVKATAAAELTAFAGIYGSAIARATLSGLLNNSQDPYFANVVLLMHMDGANNGTDFVDNSSSNKNISRIGNPVTSTAQIKIGSASALFDGSSYLTLLDSEDWNFAAGDFTVEFWYLPRTNPAAFWGLVTHQASATINNSWKVITYNNNSGLVFQCSATGTSNQFSLSMDKTLNINTWYHVAVCRSGKDLYGFIDGVLMGTLDIGAATSLFNSPEPLRIGRQNVTQANCHIDELRITKGVARYTSNFTPQSSPFPNG